MLLPDSSMFPNPGISLVVLAWRVNLPGRCALQAGYVKTAEDRRAMEGRAGDRQQPFSSWQSKPNGTEDAEREELFLATEQLLCADVPLAFLAIK